jgi:hypothetical protein
MCAGHLLRAVLSPAYTQDRSVGKITPSIKVSGSGVLSVAVCPANWDWVVQLVDTLFKALEAAGHQIKSTEATSVRPLIVKQCSPDWENKGQDRTATNESELKAKAAEGDRPITTRTSNTGALGTASRRAAYPSPWPIRQRSQWELSHLLGRWHDRKAKSLETYFE